MTSDASQPGARVYEEDWLVEIVKSVAVRTDHLKRLEFGGDGPRAGMSRALLK
jgi:hypothetical protein